MSRGILLFFAGLLAVFSSLFITALPFVVAALTRSGAMLQFLSEIPLVINIAFFALFGILINVYYKRFLAFISRYSKVFHILKSSQGWMTYDEIASALGKGELSRHGLHPD